MIQLTRLNSHPVAVNSDLIKFVEQSPDTVITLINGEKILVRETADQVLKRIIEFRRCVMQGLLPGWPQMRASSSGRFLYGTRGAKQEVSSRWINPVGEVFFLVW